MKIKHSQIVNGLVQLGFETGWTVHANEITLWEHDVPQPTEEEILKASNVWDSKESVREAEKIAAKEAAQAKLAMLGLTAQDLEALGL